jgi:8-oxo-dGTP diphosphatase
MLNQFNIRVYAIIYNSTCNAILVSDEFHLDTRMTKFPGGGLDFGEGTIDCIKREALEEFGQEITDLEHFYTTDYFQKALFFDNQQLISIYYKAKFAESPRFSISEKAYDYGKEENGKISFRWLALNEITSNTFTFPIDQKVAQMLVGI